MTAGNRPGTPPAPSAHRVARGALAHAGGVAAEAQVARHYAGLGYVLAHRRWRGRAGEIDLILRDGPQVVFVEVKRAAETARAAESLGPRQQRRILAAAAEFLAGEPRGQDTLCRIDVALVDGRGQVTVLENALAGG